MSHSSNHTLLQQLQKHLSYKKAVAVTPHNSNVLAAVPDALVVSVDGDVAMTLLEGGDVTISAIAGFPIKFSPIIVKSTGTTATGIVALYT